MPLNRLTWPIACVAIAGLAASCTHRTSDNPLTVFAAASLTDAIDAIADSFSVHTEAPVRVHVAASSVLARQIESGARADIFITADPSWGEYLIEQGIVVSGRELTITSHLVLVRRETSDSSTSLREALDSSRRLAIGDPAHVPAGAYAKDWLECMGMWGLLQNRIIPTIDVRAALAAVDTGAADAAIVYSSDTHALGAAYGGDIFRLADECQPEITYGAYVGRFGNVDRSVAFLEYLSSPARRETWTKLGFEWR
ncbi:MAG: molybdate ABC transporter substrate-binding protein [Rhodothermia bacterium]|nr:molybdate ABC transporter substrate-binding protein [Rhodothermia bacterium]